MKRSDLTDCTVCEGTGEHEQTYTSGCGGGYFKMRGRCDYCNGFGLVLIRTHNNKVVKLKLEG